MTHSAQLAGRFPIRFELANTRLVRVDACRRPSAMADAEARAWPASRSASRLYYGWIVLGLASLAMIGTLPARTQGLGLITEPLLRDIGISRVAYAQINLVATLLARCSASALAA